MRKKIIAALLAGATLMGSSAMAMQFEQPVKIGSVGGTPQGGFIIRGASSNHGSLHNPSKFQKDTVYAKGIASFGDGKDPIYFFYDCT